MIIETKFNHGDVVFHASWKYAAEMGKCDACDEHGRMKIEGHNKTIACTECYGRKDIRIGTKLVPDVTRLTIGQIRVEVTKSVGIDGSSFCNYKKQDGREEQYMCEETGIGSGSLYNAENLFATESEAFERGKFLAYEAKLRHEEDERQKAEERERYRRQLQLEQESEEVTP